MASNRAKSIWRQYFDVNKDGTAKCKYCPKVLKTCSNTTNLKQHMERKHSSILLTSTSTNQDTLFEDSQQLQVSNREQSLPSTSTDDSSVITSTPKKRSIQGEIASSFSKMLEYRSDGSKAKQITEAIMEMVCRDSLPYCVVEGKGFKKLMKLIAPLYNVPCRKTITNLIDCKYEEKKTIVLNQLKSVHNVSLTVDAWTDLQMRSFLGVTIHFIENFKIHSFDIACEPLSENHTADYITVILNKICTDWHITLEKIVSITTDNGANVVKAIETFYGRAKHVRCMAHTLNLVVENCINDTELKVFLEKTRKIVTWFHQSSVGAEELRRHQREQNLPEGKLKQLIGDVSTRWNSQLHMIQRFIDMSAIVGSILINYPNSPPMIQANEMTILKEIAKILKPFEKITEEMSSQNYVSASKAIPLIKCMTDFLETLSVEHDLTNTLKNSLLREIKKRFGNIQKVHLFSMATFLDPRFKKIHLDDPMALANTINFIKRNLQTNDGNRANNNIFNSVPEGPEATSSVSDEGDIWQSHQRLVETSNSIGNIGSSSELDLYIAAPLSDLKSDPLETWKAYMGAFPKLSAMAVKYLLVPASSAPAERLFSKAGNIVRKSRSRILGKRLPKLLFLHSLPENAW